MANIIVNVSDKEIEIVKAFNPILYKGIVVPDNATDILEKYKKIEQIVSDRYGKPMFKFMDAIVKVVEDE